MNTLKTPFTLLFLVCTWFTAQAQLVNIEAKRMQQDSIRFALKSDVLFNYTDTNGEYILEVGSNLTTRLKSRDLKKSYFFIGHYDLKRSEDKDFQNAWFLHLRFNQKLTDFWGIESFLQNQHDALLTITRRNLIGAGVRLTLISKENTKLFFGNSYMYEIEIIKDTDQHLFNHRNSTYLSVSHVFEKPMLNLTGTLYFQPLYRYIGDHRILCQLKAELPLTQHISVSALYDNFYNNFSDVLDIDRSSKVKIGLTLTI